MKLRTIDRWQLWFDFLMFDYLNIAKLDFDTFLHENCIVCL